MEATLNTSTRFSVEQRFEFLVSFTQMIANKKAKSLIILGEGGLGKTWTVNDTLRKCGVKEQDICIKKGFSTARGLYETLYDNNGKIIILDDYDSVFKNEDSVNILKGALDSYDKRILSWDAKTVKNSEYPKQYEFTGRIIFISNLNFNQIDGPILDRGLFVDLAMTNQEKIDRMKLVLNDVCRVNHFDPMFGYIAVDFFERNTTTLNKLSMRKLITVMSLIREYNDNWEVLAESQLYK